MKVSSSSDDDDDCRVKIETGNGAGNQLVTLLKPVFTEMKKKHLGFLAREYNDTFVLFKKVFRETNASVYLMSGDHDGKQGGCGAVCMSGRTIIQRQW